MEKHSVILKHYHVWCLIAAISFASNASQGCHSIVHCCCCNRDIIQLPLPSITTTTLLPSSPGPTGPARCPTPDWISDQLRSSRHCYLIIPSVTIQLSQPEAIFACIGQSGSSLAVIDNDLEKELIEKKVKLRNKEVESHGGIADTYWIHGNDGHLCNSIVIEKGILENGHDDCLLARMGFVCELVV